MPFLDYLLLKETYEMLRPRVFAAVSQSEAAMPHGKGVLFVCLLNCFGRLSLSSPQLSAIAV